ncbi:hypothetical protein OF83DRAFT_1083794 [Amylostereum chailletii]|nr:hypothetical protein OF83DRAFT_1083794 [Amylostereum chailletii]
MPASTCVHIQLEDPAHSHRSASWKAPTDVHRRRQSTPAPPSPTVICSRALKLPYTQRTISAGRTQPSGSRKINPTTERDSESQKPKKNPSPLTCNTTPISSAQCNEERAGRTKDLNGVPSPRSPSPQKKDQRHDASQSLSHEHRKSFRCSLLGSRTSRRGRQLISVFFFDLKGFDFTRMMERRRAEETCEAKIPGRPHVAKQMTEARVKGSQSPVARRRRTEEEEEG